MSAYDILAGRGVTRLCHFTKFQNLTHIVTSENGILASAAIRQDTKNVNDKARYDGELDFICCTVQYPNSWFLKEAMQKNADKIFRDWVVLYIDLRILKDKRAKFCPCNASRGHGAYICGQMERIGSIFAERVPTFSYPRSRDMLSCCPTDGQAEVMIENSVPREYIRGIAVGNEEVAGRVYAMLLMYHIENIPLYIAPKVLTPDWSAMARRGVRPEEILYSFSKED